MDRCTAARRPKIDKVLSKLFHRNKPSKFGETQYGDEKVHLTNEVGKWASAVSTNIDQY